MSDDVDFVDSPVLRKIMEYNVLILRSVDWLTANPGECGGIGALAALPELEASD